MQFIPNFLICVQVEFFSCFCPAASVGSKRALLHSRSWRYAMKIGSAVIFSDLGAEWALVNRFLVW